MANDRDKLPAKSSSAEVSEFLDKLARTPAVRPAGGRGRLIFAMDATASREPSWDRACHIQGQMFEETANLGGLEVQLVFYRGFGECRASPWVSSSRDLVAKMTAVRCLGGQTQIARVLKHAIAETKKAKVNALVFVGDCMEEDVDVLCHSAGQLGVLGVPCFMFHEGSDPIARSAFTQIAKLSGGAYCSFDAASAHMLRELLSAVAVFAAGGRRALEDYGNRAGAEVRLLAGQIGK
jgi:hypothetical protein